MILALFLSSIGPGNLVRIHGIMNATKYQDENIVASGNKQTNKQTLGHGWLFQQDNDLKHLFYQHTKMDQWP